MPIESEIMDGFWCSRCLNNHINLPDMIGSFLSGATTSMVVKNESRKNYWPLHKNASKDVYHLSSSYIEKSYSSDTLMSNVYLIKNLSGCVCQRISGTSWNMVSLTISSSNLVLMVRVLCQRYGQRKLWMTLHGKFSQFY